jgi:hypothetical protein
MIKTEVVISPLILHNSRKKDRAGCAVIGDLAIVGV